MPVNEFSGPTSWGYDPSLYFAIDSFYGGAPALAHLVNAAHVSGRWVTLDLVYNHSLDSPLMNIAPDVYRGGSYDGDLMNCGHPMVGEYFRQASVYLLRTFYLDGFRFDDTNAIITQCQGGWRFLGMIRAALHAAASAEGRPWPYCVAENQATNPWDASNPAWGVMDGQWDIDEVWLATMCGIDGSDDSLPLKTEMDKRNIGAVLFPKRPALGNRTTWSVRRIPAIKGSPHAPGSARAINWPGVRYGDSPFQWRSHAVHGPGGG